MKRIFLLIILTVLTFRIIAQPIRVAISDFNNESGIVKYNGLGRTMSSMLITDIQANVSSKSVQLLERSQIGKIFEEQKFQATSKVDNKSIVKVGKILGAEYLLVGDIYVLNDALIINARLTNIETGSIILSKKQEGKLVEWLTLKTNLAKDLAKSISIPFSQPLMSNKNISSTVLLAYSSSINDIDNGKLESAKSSLNNVLLIDENFKYAKNDLEKLIGKIENSNLNKKVSLFQHFSDVVNNEKDVMKQRNYISEYRSGLNKLYNLIELKLNPINSDKNSLSVLSELGLKPSDNSIEKLLQILKQRTVLYFNADYAYINKLFENRLQEAQRIINLDKINFLLDFIIPLQILLNEKQMNIKEIKFNNKDIVSADNLIDYTINLIMENDSLYNEGEVGKGLTLKNLKKVKELKLKLERIKN